MLSNTALPFVNMRAVIPLVRLVIVSSGLPIRSIFTSAVIAFYNGAGIGPIGNILLSTAIRQHPITDPLAQIANQPRYGEVER